MKKVCIVVPLYRLALSAFERISLEQCFRIFKAYEIWMVIPESLEKQLPEAEMMQGKTYHYKTFPNSFFRDIPSYNRLMKWPAFYQAFLAYEYMLLYQLDAFVFRDELALWCKQDWDYIGAPFVDEAAKENEDLLIGQGNGGFSLRKISSFCQVLRSCRRLGFTHPFFSSTTPWYLNLWRDFKYNGIYNFSCYPFQPVVNEDIFWSQLVPAKFKAFKVPQPAQALAFSFEVAPRRLFELNDGHFPFGCHAWSKYEFDFWKPYIEEAGYEV